MRNRNFKVVMWVLIIGAMLALIGYIIHSYIENSRRAKLESSLKSYIETKWDEYCKQNPGIPGGISLMVTSGKDTYFIPYKMGEDMTEDTRFRTASITKTFTATAIMLLQQKGLLNIDDTIVSKIPGSDKPYLPDTPDYNIPYKSQITIKQILQHRAGIFDLNNSEIPENLGVPYAGTSYITYGLSQDLQHTFTADEFAAVISANQLSYGKPGSEYHYSDTGYSLLSKIIERVSGESYGDFVTNNILKANKLSSSMLPYLGTDQTMPKPFVLGYDYYGGQSSPAENYNISFQIGNGNLVTTLRDLSNFTKLLFTGRAGLDMKYVNMMKETVKYSDAAGYGLGCQEIYGTGYGHSGAIRGYLSATVYDPASDATIVIISNVMNWSDMVNEVLFHREVAHEVKGIIDTQK